ncbi:Uncharacterised protein [Bordetella ansorpii]|uniref:Uncharacterized protein n=1 Tax=Bordetella ansorpii TaxID=288768 RepID=A0A157QPP8_9BORD|nr:hypothetical protein [Bordetella ansorpii]SAI47578.1 Uncharacterised protein [Bordetella ansorpii]
MPTMLNHAPRSAFPFSVQTSAASATASNTMACPIAAPDFGRDFLSDQAHQFLRLELDNGAVIPSVRDNHLLSRCANHLMAICRCSQRTAETYAAQAIAELASHRSSVAFDIDRSTTYCLFVNDRASGTTRAISAAEVLALLRQAEAAAVAA